MRATLIFPVILTCLCAQVAAAVSGSTKDETVTPITYQRPLAPVDTPLDPAFLILNMAREYLTDQANGITENPLSSRSRGTNQLSMDKVINPLSTIIQQEAPRLRFIRDYLRGTPEEHDWSKVNLRNPKVMILGVVATVTVTEDTEMHYKSLPNSAFYSLNHTLGFLQVNGDWKLRIDDLEGVGDISPTPYSRGSIFKTPHDDVSAISPELADPVDPQNIQSPNSIPNGIRVPPNPAERLIDPDPGPTPDPYNGNLAADYALKWARGNNPAYPAYSDDDCTNFASQALFAGGWTEDVAHNWYSHSNGLERTLRGRGQTYFKDVGVAWTKAALLWNYGVSRGRFLKVTGAVNRPDQGGQSYFGPAMRGDLAFADWTPQDSSNYTMRQHTMVVTTVPGNGLDWSAVQISSHSNSEKNLSLRDIVAGAAAIVKTDKLVRIYFARPKP
jgi:hypothetical protein